MNASVAIQTLPEAKNDEELIRIVDEVIAYILRPLADILLRRTQTVFAIHA